MEEFKDRPVVFSLQYAIDTDNIYNYGKEIFGGNQAQNYESIIDKITTGLTLSYLIYPECRFLPTKSHLYRNIILESHLIIYRVKTERIEVLRAIHSQSSISRIRSVRKIKI